MWMFAATHQTFHTSIIHLTFHTSCHSPNIPHQMSLTKHSTPTVTHLTFCTSDYSPNIPHQLSPNISHQLSFTQYSIPAVTQHSTPVVTHPTFHSSCHSPNILNQLLVNSLSYSVWFLYMCIDRRVRRLMTHLYMGWRMCQKTDDTLVNVLTDVSGDWCHTCKCLDRCVRR